jgi:hypothetical protein
VRACDARARRHPRAIELARSVTRGLRKKMPEHGAAIAPGSQGTLHERELAAFKRDGFFIRRGTRSSRRP